MNNGRSILWNGIVFMALAMRLASPSLAQTTSAPSSTSQLIAVLKEYEKKNGKPTESVGLNTATDASLEQLKQFVHIRVLYLKSTQVTDAGMVHLKALTKLQGVDLSGTQVTRRGLEQLTQLSDLRWLSLIGTGISDADLELFAKFPLLQFLDLSGTSVTDAGLAHLERLPRLETIELYGADVTAAGIQRLRQRLMKTTVSALVEGQSLPESSPEFQRATTKAKAMNSVAAGLSGEGYVTRATLQQRVLTILQRLYPASTHPNGQHEIAVQLNKLGVSYSLINDFDKSRSYYQQAIAIYEALYPRDKHPNGNRDFAMALNNLRKVLSDSKDQDKKIQCAERLLPMYEHWFPSDKFPERQKNLVEILHDLALAHRRNNGIEKAEECMARAVAILRQLYPPDKYPNGHKDLAAELNMLGVAYSYGKTGNERNCYEEAVGIYDRLEKAGELLQPDGRVAVVLRNLGMTVARTGDYVRSLELYQRSLAIYQALSPTNTFPKGNAEVATTLDYMASSYIKLGGEQNKRKAAECYERALAIYQDIYPLEKFPKGHITQADTLYNLADVLADVEENQRAGKRFQEALARYQTLFPEGHKNIVAILGRLSWVVYFQGNHALGREYAEKAYDACVKLYPEDKWPDGHRETASCLYSLGAAASRSGDRERAREYYEQALVMFRHVYTPEELQKNGSYKQLLIHLAALIQGDNSEKVKAREYAKEALEIDQRRFPKEKYPEGSTMLAWTLMMVAGIAPTNTAHSLQYIEPAVAMYRHFYPPDKHPRGNFHFGNALISLGDKLKSTGDFKRAREIWEETLAMNQRLYPAEEYPQGSPNLARAMASVGELLAIEGQHEKAFDHLNHGVRMGQDIANIFSALTSEAEAINNAGRLPRGCDALISLSPLVNRSTDDIYAHIWRARGAIFQFVSERQKKLLQDESPEARSLYQSYFDTRRQLAGLALAPADNVGNDIQARRARVQELSRRKEELERKLSGQLGDVGRREALARRSHTDLIAALPTDTAFVDVLSYTHSSWSTNSTGKLSFPKTTRAYVAFVLTRNQPVRMVSLGTTNLIDAAATQWRETIVDGRTSDAAAKLRKRVWEPIQKEFPKGISTVLLTPDGALASIPWAALPGSKPQTVLLEEYALSFVPNGPFLLDQLTAKRKPTGASDMLLAIGNVSYDQQPKSEDQPLLLASLRAPAQSPDAPAQWPHLPGTSKELKEIQSFAAGKQTVALTGAEAAMPRVLAELPKARWAVFATHGFFADSSFRASLRLDDSLFDQTTGALQKTPANRSPMLMSGLVLAGANLPRTKDANGVPQGDGGILTAEAIAALPLDNLELAVLSACETGLGKASGGEGLFGLQRAFHQAGTRHVVASLWKVSDVATVALMRLFYAKLWQEKKSPSEALREAQLALYRNSSLMDEIAASRGIGGVVKTATPSDVFPGKSPSSKTDTRFWAAFTISGAGQ